MSFCRSTSGLRSSAVTRHEFGRSAQPETIPGAIGTAFYGLTQAFDPIYGNNPRSVEVYMRYSPMLMNLLCAEYKRTF